MNKIWRLSSTVGAKRVLFLVSFSESIFFPIPPDLMLIPMILARRQAAFKIAAVCLAGNLLGAAAGYFIGKFFMDAVGLSIINFYTLQEQYLQIQQWYESYSAWAVTVAALTPIPYKVCTITAGAFEINFFIFMLASLLARGLRFFTVAGLLYLFGDRVRFFIEKRLDLIMLLTLIGVVAGFVLFKYLQF